MLQLQICTLMVDCTNVLRNLEILFTIFTSLYRVLIHWFLFCFCLTIVPYLSYPFQCHLWHWVFLRCQNGYIHQEEEQNWTNSNGSVVKQSRSSDSHQASILITILGYHSFFLYLDLQKMSWKKLFQFCLHVYLEPLW